MSENYDESWPNVQPLRGFFDLWRKGQYPTMYPANQTPVTSDVLEAGFIFAGVILAFSLLIILPGIRSGDRISTLVRIVLGVFILTTIMLCNFGQEWEVAHVQTKTQYRAGLSKEIKATVGVKIGLRCVNFTLKGDPVVQMFNSLRVNETINYNERISWDNDGWTVGRGGFGPYAGRFNQEFREHQRKGSPYPILWAAEYFTLDGEGVRWGRHYLQAGYYAHIMLWTALPLWLLSMILFKMVIRYGAYFSLLTGLSMLSSNAIWAGFQNPNPLVIPFEDGHLKFTWGWSFWLCVFTGMLCCTIGIVVVILNHFCAEQLSDFFGVDITQDLEEFYVDQTEEDDKVDSRRFRRRTREPTIILKGSNVARGSRGAGGGSASPVEVVLEEGGNDIEMQAQRDSAGVPVYQRNESYQAQNVQRGYRRRTLFPASQKRSQKRTPRPTPPPPIPQQVTYANT
jgi:hypothetical protein